ncbi:uncharacterized protein TRAVEDRAFT_66597 [Trametes versicolor FP-101664 SS1]|uniref:uncharacterized protein n=1 Tax=Trametes versicolor (strain FP-101664) TaxID=717944 RepID=UPI00046212D2|nr:uncharacterized protein TRAVEDRAFT_66597 [Trametes versicolor FP-101664 SS1]EIW53815.1 hypothetical protein TRAVEDRAFT_66597 [Trametes versicolor FP-101664 SS1]
MMFKSLSAVAVIAAPAGVNAQDATSSAPPTSTSGLPTCILTCIATAATQGWRSAIADINCLCTNTAVQQASLSDLLPAVHLLIRQARRRRRPPFIGSIVSGASSVSSAASTNASSATSAATSAATSIASGASSAESSATSALSSVISSVASTASSAASSISRRLNSAMSTSIPVTSGASSAGASQTSNAASAMGRGSVGGSYEGLVGTGVALVGAVIGAGLVL